MKIKKRKFYPDFKLKNFKGYILGSVVFFLAVSCIFMAIQSGADGAEIASLQNRQKDLLNRHQELTESIVEAHSINSLSLKSAEMGFVKLSNLVYVTDAAPVAKLP